MKPVVHGDKDDILLDDGAHPVEVLGAKGEAAAVYPDHHGERLCVEVKRGRGEHIQGEAVLRAVIIASQRAGQIRCLENVNINKHFSGSASCSS